MIQGRIRFWPRPHTRWWVGVSALLTLLIGLAIAEDEASNETEIIEDAVPEAVEATQQAEENAKPDAEATPNTNAENAGYDPFAEKEEEALPELWFPVGEEITYRVFWGRIPVGTSVASTEWVEEGGRTLLVIRFRTQSNRVLDKIYPVDDLIESVIDPHTFLPVRFTKNLSEGRYRAHEVTEFDYEHLIAHWRSLTRGRENTFELEPDTRDLVSFSYYMRKEGFKKGDRRQYRVMADDKIYDLWLEARGNDNIRLRHYGRVSSIEVEPEAAFEGLFVRRGRITLWVSNDERRILTQMVGSIPVASIRLVLHRVRGPGNDSWILDIEDDDDDA